MIDCVECDACQKGANSIALEHSRRYSVGQGFCSNVRDTK